MSNFADAASRADDLLARQDNIRLVREFLAYIAETEPQVHDYAELILTDDVIKRGQAAAMLGVNPSRIDYLKKRLRKLAEGFLSSKGVQDV